MPQTREEYERHLHYITNEGLRFVVLWQVPDSEITTEMINYYSKLGTPGFIIGNDKNAELIKKMQS